MKILKNILNYTHKHYFWEYFFLFINLFKGFRKFYNPLYLRYAFFEKKNSRINHVTQIWNWNLLMIIER